MTEIEKKDQNLTLKIQKFLKTDINYLTSGAFWITFGGMAVKILSLVLAYFFANYISKEDYGLFKYITATVSLFFILGLSGINTSTIRSVSMGFEGVIKQGFKLRLKWSFWGSVALFFLGLYYFNAGNHTAGYGFIVAAAFFPFFDTPTIYKSFLNGKKMFKEETIIEILITAAYTAVMAATIFFTKNIFIIVCVYFGTYVVLRNAAYFFIIGRHQPNEKTDDGWIAYGKHLTAMDILTNAANYLDRIILFQAAGPVSVAIYSFASAAPEQLKALHSFIPIIGFPKWSGTDAAEIKKSLPRKMVLFLAESVILIIIYIISAPFIFKLFFPLYLDAVFLSQLYMLSFLNFAPTFILPILQAKGRVKELYFLNIASPLTQIVFLAIGGFWFGLTGIVIARVLGRIMMTVYALALYKRI